ncbi:MAG: hypothetical protein QM572_01305 [Nocardioides sp.]|uniref:hypothetical protein n=1 Tax=Nocardioides sp. TaxID=35761 RepID=UPI0039E5E65C
MDTTPWRLALTTGAVGLLTLGVALVPTPAHAAVTSGTVGVSGYSSVTGTDCGATVWSSPVPSSVDITDNGATVTSSFSRTGTVTKSSATTDVTDLAQSASISAKLTPINGGPAALTISGSSTQSVVPRLSASACDVYAYSSAGFSATVDLPTATWVSISGSGKGRGSLQAYIASNDNAAGAIAYAFGEKGTGSGASLLPAGKAYIYGILSASSVDSDDTIKSSSYTGSATLDLKPVGYGSAVSGKGKKYVAPGERNCTTNTVSASLTKAAKKKASKVVVTAGGHKVTLKGKKLTKASTVTLPVASTSATTLTATITPKKGKKVTVSRSYLACG